MPEALAVLAVLVVALAAWIGAWMHARDPANFNAREETERLRHHAAWLEGRLEVARREKWSHDMVVGITDELAETSKQLTQLSAPTPARQGVG